MASRYLRFELRAPREPRAAPLLERLLARADEVAAEPDWRAEAFRSIAPRTAMPPVAAVAYRAAGGSLPLGSVFLATPVHYLAEISNVRLADDGILSLDAAEAAVLADDFNRLWSDSGVVLWAASARLFCGFHTPVAATTHDPALVRGRHLENLLPVGNDAARLRAVMSEMEMWLFDHALNRDRRQRAQLPMSALWLWGGGEPLAALPAVQGGAAGGDVFFDAFPPLAGRRADIRVVDVAPHAPEWVEMEANWLVPTLADLSGGGLEQLTLSAGGRRFRVGRGWRRKFWRRARRWWEYFES